MSSGTLSDAIEMVSTMDIVEHFGVPYQERRGRTYLLCPGHNDTHFGSCYVDKNDNGYYCYVCSEYHNKWEMLKKVSGYTDADAADWFFRTSGVTPTKQANPLTPIIQLIKNLAHFVDNSTVYNDIHTCEKKESSYGRMESGEYLYSEQAIPKPMLELYKQDKSLFVEVITEALKTKKAQYDEVISFCAKHEKDKCFIDGVFQQNPKYSEIRKSCETSVSEINGLIEELSRL